jgi:hypothetical protein
MRQDTLMQHIRIGDNDISMRSYHLARVPWCIAIKGESPNSEVTHLVEFQQFRDLILGQGFGGKKIECF